MQIKWNENVSKASFINITTDVEGSYSIRANDFNGIHGHSAGLPETDLAIERRRVDSDKKDTESNSLMLRYRYVISIAYSFELGRFFVSSMGHLLDNIKCVLQKNFTFVSIQNFRKL